MFDNIVAVLPEIRVALVETLYMLFVTVGFAIVLGLPLGTLLYYCRPGSLIKAPFISFVLNGIVNLVRSFPFLILLVALIPVTRFIVGTSIGTTAATVPMIVGAVPYFARLVEQTFLEVNRGTIEAAESMGATHVQIIWKVLYGEAGQASRVP